MSESELVAVARRGVDLYFGRRGKLALALDRYGYGREWFLWPAYRSAAKAPPNYELRGSMLGVATEVRNILGRAGDTGNARQRHEYAVYRGVGATHEVAAARGDVLTLPVLDDAAAPESRPTPLARWCEALPVRRRCGWPWRVRVMSYLYAVEGWTLAEVGAAVGLSESGAWFVLRPYLDHDGAPPNYLAVVPGTYGRGVRYLCRVCGVRPVGERGSPTGRCRACYLGRRGGGRETAGATACPGCGQPVPQKPLGRPRKYCSDDTCGSGVRYVTRRRKAKGGA